MLGNSIPVLTLLACLMAVGYQDLRYRQVYVYVFILFFLNALYLQYIRCGFEEEFIIQSSANVFICILQFGTALLYVRFIKKIKMEHALGIGDILYYVCIVPLLSTPVFIMYNIISLIGVILFIALFRIPKQNVPLAGLQALLLAAAVLTELVFPSVHLLGTCNYFLPW